MDPIRDSKKKKKKKSIFFCKNGGKVCASVSIGANKCLWDMILVWATYFKLPKPKLRAACIGIQATKSSIGSL